MIRIRRADDRGATRLNWLESRHTFSFNRFHDPDYVGFRDLRVINEDRVAPGAGFSEHGHRDMEIITYVLSGMLMHGDSMGHERTIGPGDVQVMTAGSGIRHREFNGSMTEPLHLLQIWIRPRVGDLEPRYDQRHYDDDDLVDRWRVIVSADGVDGSLVIMQDVTIHAARLGAGKSLSLDVPGGRYGWLQVAEGDVTLSGEFVEAGDGVAITGPESLTITAGESPARLLRFDLK